jgi:hypothetical protein
MSQTVVSSRVENVTNQNYNSLENDIYFFMGTLY